MAEADDTLTPVAVEALRRVGIDATMPPMPLEAFLASEPVRRGTSVHHRIKILRRAGEAKFG